MRFILSGSIGGGRFFAREYRDIKGEIRLYNLNDNYSLELEKKISYRDPPSVVAKGRRRLTGGHVNGDFFYATTFSQILRFNLKTYSTKTVYTSTNFNDLHGIHSNGHEYAVVNTGLDLVHILNSDFTEKRIIDIGRISGSTKRFSANIDYRTVPSTKPHVVHPNHCFWFENSWWTTRFVQQDAYCLDTRERWDFSSFGQPHDGLVTSQGVFFTTVTGYLLKVGHNRQITSWHIPTLTHKNHLGWGRGVMVSGDKAFVSFTKIRKSISSMAKHATTAPKNTPPLDSRIVILDLKKGQVIKEIPIKDSYFRHLTLFALVEY